jgi:CheY-like chemotaxis protein
VVPSLEGLRILLLEDEVLIAMDVEQLFLDQGAAEVVTIRNLEDIDEDAVTGNFDAVVVDVMLNGVSTLGFAARLKEMGIPFVFASGVGKNPDMAAAFPDTILVSKPYSGSDLTDAIVQSIKAGNRVE